VAFYLGLLESVFRVRKVWKYKNLGMGMANLQLALPRLGVGLPWLGAGYI
jgi:hypothetical protein